MTNPTSSSNNISYLGIADRNPGETYVRRRSPVPQDIRGYKIGDRWIDKTSQSAYILVSKSGNVATWVNIGGASSSVSSLTGDIGAPIIPVLGNINVQGGAAGAISFSNGGVGQMNALVLVDGTTISIIGNQLVVGGTIASLYTEDVGSATPAAGNLNIFGTAAQGISTSGAGSTVTVTAADADTVGGKGVSTYDPDDFTVTAGLVQLNGAASGTATTVGAVTADVITFPMGVVPAVVEFDALVAAFESVTPAGAGYAILGAVRSDGVTATLVGTPDVTLNEEAALVTAHATIVVSGNNAVVRVTGVALLTINWKAAFRSVSVT